MAAGGDNDPARDPPVTAVPSRTKPAMSTMMLRSTDPVTRSRAPASRNTPRQRGCAKGALPMAASSVPQRDRCLIRVLIAASYPDGGAGADSNRACTQAYRFGRRRDAALTRPATGPALDPGGLHAAQLVLQFLDLVAQPRGQLELQLRSGGVHLVGELGDEADQVLASRPAFARVLAL